MKGENSTRYRIAYVATPVTFGGAEKVSLNFLRHADRDLFAIEPILFLRPWDPPTYFESKLQEWSFRYHCLPVARSKVADPLRPLKSLLALNRTIAAGGYDLIHTHGYIADCLGSIISKARGIPIVSTCHGYIYQGVKLHIYNRLDQFALKSFDKIIAVSSTIHDTLLASRIAAKKIIVIENAVPDLLEEALAVAKPIRKTLGVDDEDVLLGYFGRLSQEKGLCYLLDAVKLALKVIPDLKLLLVGDGAQKEELKAKIADLALENNVFMAGFRNNVGQWMAAVDMFMLPSLTEGTPMALLEAMSMGLPCIATEVGGVPGIIESGADGILVPPAEAGLLAEAVVSLSADPERRRSLGAKARKKVLESYSVHRWARRIEEEYVKTISAFRRQPQEPTSPGEGCNHEG